MKVFIQFAFNTRSWRRSGWLDYNYCHLFINYSCHQNRQERWWRGDVSGHGGGSAVVLQRPRRNHDWRIHLWWVCIRMCALISLKNYFLGSSFLKWYLVFLFVWNVWMFFHVHCQVCSLWLCLYVWFIAFIIIVHTTIAVKEIISTGFFEKLSVLWSQNYWRGGKEAAMV